MQFRPYPVMTAFTAAAFVILILFGNWQWGRYEQKMGARDTAPDWADITAAIIPGTEQAVYAYAEGRSAWRITVAAETADGVILLPRQISYEVEPPDILPLAVAEAVTLRGLWHPPSRRNAFSAEDQPQFGLYYTFDPVRMAETLPPSVGARLIPRVFEPETLVLIGTAEQVANPMLQPGDPARLPPERHFGYALTWWGLAIGLIGVYLAFHYQKGRLRFGQEKE
ncbi:SURF1 family protein [Hyphomonas sp.]|uniref:SURF1 family protein n=1 Tax=Hyphomonas sp. TaxID=87 RepID=UPI0039196AE4